MLALLARFGPALIPALIGAIPALAAGWFAHGVKFDWFDRPAIVREQQAICLSKVEAAAAKATRDEQLRQFRAGEAATEQFIQESQEAADDQEARETLLEMELKAYEERLAKSGKTQCRIDADDLSVLGLQFEPSTSTGRQ